MIPQKPEAVSPRTNHSSASGSGRRSQSKSRSQSLNWRSFQLDSCAGAESLRDELVTYQTHLATLLERKGEYVLIKGSEVIAIYPTLDEALEAGAGRFGQEPALIKQIVAREPIQSTGGLVF